MQNFRVVGVLNVTPDSYFDRGKHSSVDAALKHAGQMIAEGADIIEIGGESTGPNSRSVSIDEELSRTVPVIEALRERFPRITLSIDTYKSTVAHEALERGVLMINDVTAGRADPELFPIAALYEANIVLMYSKDATPRTTVEDRHYEDVVATIRTFLLGRMEAAEDAGVKRQQLIVDPGLGHFVSSDPQYSFAILERLSEFAAIAPVLISPSRKSFLAGAEKLPPEDRLPGTVASSAIAVLHGARFIRTHDVLAVRRGCEVASSVSNIEHS